VKSSTIFVIVIVSIVGIIGTASIDSIYAEHRNSNQGSYDCTLKNPPNFDRNYEKGFQFKISIDNPGNCQYIIKFYDSTKHYIYEYRPSKLTSSLSFELDLSGKREISFLNLMSVNDGRTASEYYPITIIDRAAESKAAQDLTNLLIIGGITIMIISLVVVLVKRKNQKSNTPPPVSPPPPTPPTNTEASTVFFYECPKCQSGDIENNPDGSVNCPSCGYRS
jgi:hypothetical protein